VNVFADSHHCDCRDRDIDVHIARERVLIRINLSFAGSKSKPGPFWSKRSPSQAGAHATTLSPRDDEAESAAFKTWQSAISGASDPGIQADHGIVKARTSLFKKNRYGAINRGIRRARGIRGRYGSDAGFECGPNVRG
jgi:hypothetical protein